MQNYAYWDTSFCLGTHKFYNAGVLCRHVFLIGMCRNPVADGWGSKAFDFTSPHLSSHGGMTHCRSVVTNHIIGMMCNLHFSEV